MPAVSKRELPKMDMNPMTDMAFLLISFFMLTTQFKTDDVADIQKPASTSEIKLPERDLAIITIDEEGKIYYGIDGKFNRRSLLSHMSSQLGVKFTDDEYKSFELVSNFGIPLAQLPEFLSLDPSERKEVQQSGIPFDSTQNELVQWLVYSRIANPKIRVAVQADRKVDYPLIKKVMEMLVKNKITRFNLITDLEKAV